MRHLSELKIFIVEDNFMYSYLLENALKEYGNFKITTFETAEKCIEMLEKVQTNSILLKYVARSKISSLKARQLIFKAFILPYLQLIYAVWALLLTSVIDRIEAKKQLVHN